jgi:hypothetical protein
MTTTLLVLTLAVFGAADTPDTKEKPKHSPYAPSLPYLTKEEEDKLDEIVDRFMLYDIGRLQGADARKALKEFKNLGPEAIPALVRGLNRAAQIEHSCPVVVIAQKLGRLLAVSEDRELLEFVRDNIGAGVGRTRHAGVLQDLRFGVSQRKNAVARRPKGGAKSPRTMRISELADAASSERGPRLKLLLTELSNRRGKEVLPGLANAAGSYDKDIQKLGRDLLYAHLTRQSEAVVKEKLTDEQPEIRKAAVRVVVNKMPRLTCELIALLADEQTEVRGAAHDALVKLSRVEDYGPPADATTEQIGIAQGKWRSWWNRKSRR